MAKHQYEVIVGNIGRVHEGGNFIRACGVFVDYMRQSDKGVGRAAGEPVYLMKDGDVRREHTPRRVADNTLADGSGLAPSALTTRKAGQSVDPTNCLTMLKACVGVLDSAIVAVSEHEPETVAEMNAMVKQVRAFMALPQGQSVGATNCLTPRKAEQLHKLHRACMVAAANFSDAYNKTIAGDGTYDREATKLQKANDAWTTALTKITSKE
jgi:hypothetical protein